ncbi:DUF4145 domain-containing protein [Microbacterium sp. KR10-403]|uniref:DUF4145 domain-containing protein n=1 Tax=Microbacterium sp. KR10-403 TaxID=3158581 RepID=UPI0032E482E9
MIDKGAATVFARDDSSTRSTGLGSRPNTWTMSTCFACKRGTVWRGAQIMFPQANPFPMGHSAMPSNAAELYEEARSVAVVSRRAGAALGRAALESLLGEVRPQFTGRLDDRIAALQPEVSLGLWQILSVLRHTGNKALHGSDISDGLVTVVMDDDGSTLGLLLGAINDLVEELVARPAQAVELFALLPEGGLPTPSARPVCLRWSLQRSVWTRSPRPSRQRRPRRKVEMGAEGVSAG